MKISTFVFCGTLSVMIIGAIVLLNVGQLQARTAPEFSVPPSEIKLLEDDNDGKKEIHVTGSADLRGFDDVSLEPGMVHAQVMCEEQWSPTAGNASSLNATELNLAKCPQLLKGVRAQMVGTETMYSFECLDCEVAFKGYWQRKPGVRAWRGEIKVTPTGDTPILRFIPLQYPPQ